MIISVIFVLLFLAFLMGIILVPKIDGKINMIKVAVMGIMAIFCYQSFWAFMFQLVGIPVNLKSTCISMAAAVLLLWGMIIKKKKMQRIFVRITDIAVLAVLAGIVIAVSLHMFTTYLRLSYINSDLAAGSLNNFLVLDEEQFLGFYYDNNEGKMCGGLFTHVKPEDIKDRIVLTLAGNYIDYDLKRKVVEYNKSGDTYRIVVKEYNTYNTSEDYTLGVKQLNNDIISGGMPDILVVDSNMSMDSYIAKGLVANVDDLIAGDEELSKNDYLQNVWDAYRVDGKLYYVIPSFYISTMVGKESIFGDRTSITMEELQTIRDTMPEGTALFSDETRDSFLYTMMNYCGSDFVDVSTGKCAFDTDNFVAMLTYAAGLPVEYGEDYWGEDYWNNYESQFREDRTLLDGISISNIRDLNGTINGVFGEDISFVGFPTDGDMGSILWAGNRMYALSAKSKNLDGAWEFLRYYLTQEYQDKIQEQEYNLPVLRSTFEKNVQDATKKPYYTDENGNKVEYDETYYINGEEILLPQLTQEQVDRIVSFVESVNKRGYYNEAISNIISEEAGAYFSGQKSARDVAGVIQSRVQVYVNENR